MPIQSMRNLVFSPASLVEFTNNSLAFSPSLRTEAVYDDFIHKQRITVTDQTAEILFLRTAHQVCNIRMIVIYLFKIAL